MKDSREKIESLLRFTSINPLSTLYYISSNSLEHWSHFRFGLPAVPRRLDWLCRFSKFVTRR